jgi:hypothetical protein
MTSDTVTTNIVRLVIPSCADILRLIDPKHDPTVILRSLMSTDHLVHEPLTPCHSVTEQNSRIFSDYSLKNSDLTPTRPYGKELGVTAVRGNCS